MNRRTFVKSGLAGAVALSFPYRYVWAFGQSPLGVTKFTQPLRGLGAAPAIPVASPVASIPGQYDLYDMQILESEFSFHPNIGYSKVWGYAQSGTAPSYLGGVVVAKQGQPVRMRFTNTLPSTHPLPVDPTLTSPPPVGTLPPEGNVPGAGQNNRTAVHLHGGLLDWTSDGGPFDWFTPNGNYGPSLPATSPIRHDAQGRLLAGNQVELYQPNQQSARFAWYHDHAVGITRLNAYAGIASAFLITDALEQWLVTHGYLPNVAGYPLGIPLVIQDKTFVDGTDPNYVWGNKGDLFYPYLYEANINKDGSANPKGRWDWGPTVQPPANPPAGGWRSLPAASCVPEFYSDTSLVNGVAYPFLPVEQRHYRFRILNGSQARFYNLNLYYESARRPGEVDTTTATAPDGTVTVVPVGKPGPAIVQIGTEGGFLDFPVLLNSPPQPCEVVLDPNTGNWVSGKYNLLLGPGERADIVVDFSRVPTGAKLILYNDAPAPFPGGDPRNDYYTGAPDFSSVGGAPTLLPQFGPNSRTLMQFQVVARTGAADPATTGILEQVARLGSSAGQSQFSALFSGLGAAANPASAARVRNLTRNEDFDEYGRLVQRLGTDVMPTPTAGTFGRDYDTTPTEVVKAGSVEIWRIYNTTGDTHPMHFHLVNVRVLSRRSFTYTVSATGALKPALGPARPADPNERGPKETVRMNPGEMTELLISFDLPKNLPYSVPFSPRLKNKYNINGYEYVWHCHILEHEEHDMMRPLVIVP
jgi:spore coat protein A, manganese oxidase